MNNVLIKRDILDQLISHLSQREITLITGARQVGKTTLMKRLETRVNKQGGRSLFLSLDFEEDGQFFKSQSDLIKKIDLELGRKKGFVFIDEIQRKHNAGLFLKGIYDRNLPYKFIISGSGSLELKEKIHESLAGRKRIFEMSSISFKEIVNFRTAYAYENRLDNFFSIEKEKTKRLLDEYLNFGGYPRVILENSLKEKEAIIKDIYKSYLEKDIAYLLNIDRVDAFSLLIKLLASQTGRIVNYSELSSSAGISFPTLKNYLWYTEKTFILNWLLPYFKNKRSEVIKSPTAYFNDLGLRNYAVGNFGKIGGITDRDYGFIFQNFVFLLLKEKIRETAGNLYFWRTKSGAEIDFILEKGGEIIPIEVKIKKFKQPEVERSFASFIDKYKSKKAYVITVDFEAEMKKGKTLIQFLPFWKIQKI